MVLIAAALLTAGTVVFTLLIRSRDIPEPAPVSPTAHLEERKAQIYENLRDLAKVLAEIDSLTPQVKAKAAGAPAPAKPKSDGRKCPHCGATFAQPLKFCGECGKAMQV